MTQTVTSGAPEYPLTSTMAYCYDNADQLTSDTVTAGTTAMTNPAELLINDTAFGPRGRR